jgi:RNA-directed DNA polymerase
MAAFSEFAAAQFGRHVANRRARRGLGKPETFKFLGFIHICGQSRRGKFLLKRKP